MSLDPSTLWSRALADLQVSMSSQHFHMWIEKATLVENREVGDDRAIGVIMVPSAMHLQMIEGRFYASIKEAVDRVSGKKFELQFKVGSATVAITPTAQPAPTSDSRPVSHTHTTSPAPSADLFAAVPPPPTMDGFRAALHRAKLRPDFNFDNFAVSTTNEMAHAAAVAVSKSPGSAYNPLFLYGGVGVGKTHLMQAVGQNILTDNSQANIIYCAGEEFTNEIISAIQTKKTIQFKEKYRKVDVLLIDDIQFLAGKTSVQEEFFHTFNAVTQSGGQIIMTSDRPPHEITLLEDRLRSRFEAGLIIDIQQPTFELRTAIVLIKAEAKGIELSMEMAQQIASMVDNARRIEGVISQLHSQHTLMKKAVTLDLVKSVLSKEEMPSITNNTHVKPKDVIKTVAAHFKVTTTQLCGRKRSRPLVDYRHIAMFLLHEDLGLPYIQVGMEFGGRDHTSIMHAVSKINSQLETSDTLQTSVSAIRASLMGKG